MSSKQSNSWLRGLVLGLWIGLLAVGGVYLGVKLASRPSGDGAVSPRSTPSFLQATAAQLPTVQLLGDDSVPRATEHWLDRRGTVVLFLDPYCEPCKFMARQWQVHYESGDTDGFTVLGISAAPAEDVEHFKEQLAIDYEIVLDPTASYATRHGIDTFPWEIVVDGRGKVLAYTGDSQRMAAIHEVKAALGLKDSAS